MLSYCEDISVIICAYTLDRWDRLRAAIESVRRQSRPASQIIVVVDHNQELLERVRSDHPDLIVIENRGEPGLSGGRNSGVDAATADVVAFLDDDAIADVDWLENIARAYDDEGILGVGGRIEPLWQAERPPWFPPEFDWVIGCSYEGLPEERSAVRNVIGANMSFKRAALLEVGGFSSGLGRTHEQPLGCEETDVCIRLAQRFGEGAVTYEPRAVVSHFVPESRAQWAYFWSRCHAEGISKARLSGSVGTRDGLASERRYVTSTLPKGALTNVRKLVSDGDGWAVARTGALLGGLGVTGLGYARAKLGSSPSRRDASPIARAAGSSESNGARGSDVIRLLVVTPRYLPLVGGVEHHVDQVCRRLPPDIEATVLTTDPTGTLPAEETIDGIRVCRVPAWPREKDYYVAPAVRRFIRDGKWDLVHVQSYHTAVAPLAMDAARRANIPYVLTFHGGGHSSRTRRAMRGVQWSALRPLLARAERLIAVAEFEAEFFSERLGVPRSRFAVIPNGSDLQSALEDAEHTPDPGDPVERRVIASVGRLERYKGHHRVVQAMPHVLAQEPDVDLHVVGSGPYQSEIERMAAELGVSDNVRVGSVPAGDRALMARTLAGFTLVVLMSDFETHPLAVMEALALGRPVLVADTSGLRELAEQGLARSIPLDSNAAEIAEAIVEELRNPRSTPPIALPSWDECAEGVVSVYREVLAEPMEQPHVRTSSRLEGA